MRANTVAVLALSPFLVAGPAAFGLDRYEFIIDAAASSVDQSLSMAVPLAGAFMGDHDPVENPGGTQTIPGLFGGSGNNPIDYEATLLAELDGDSVPEGGALLAIDTRLGTVTVSGLAIDLLGGAAVGLGVTLEIEYDSFHTVNPSAIFPGGVTIPIPLGSVGTIESVTATQTAAVMTALMPAGADLYTLAALVPVDLAISATILGQPVAEGIVIPAALPLVGTLDLSRATPVLTANITQAIVETMPLDGLPFSDIALPVPTVLPPGGTANLLMSGMLESLLVDASINATLVATATPLCAPADLDCNGVVDGADLGLLLAAWGTPGPGDLNGDGVVDGADLGLLLASWS